MILEKLGKAEFQNRNDNVLTKTEDFHKIDKKGGASIGNN